MARPQSRRKVKLSWYQIKAPEYLGGGIIGETPVTKHGTPIDRVVVIPLNMVTNNIRHVFINIALRIVETEDSVAKTIYWGHELSRDRVTRMVRKRTSRIDIIKDVTTADGVKLRVKPIIITHGRANTSVQSAIRKEVEAFLDEYVSSRKLPDLLKEMFDGITQKLIFSKAVKIHPINSVEIRKVEVKETYKL